MSPFLDHVFITCEPGAPEAAALLDSGFVEGSGNTHPGQGTANRRFFFANFMLELLWVADPGEAASDSVRPTGLWERWSRRNDGASRFGFLFGGTFPAGQPALATEPYFPAYLPAGVSIEIAKGLALHEPAIFFMPWLGASRPVPNEPIGHGLQVREMTGAIVGVPSFDGLSVAARRARDAGLLGFVETAAPILEVRFRSSDSHVVDLRPQLPVVFATDPE